MQEHNTKSSGTLYVVATPIGNLDDFSSRALSVLRSVDIILAEDTRNFGRLAKRFEISTKALSYHDHNESSRAQDILAQLAQGKSAALVSDAGTPTLSDPGYRIVKACREADVSVIPIPGPSAAIAALSVSGFETDRFSFFGFLPQKPGKREKTVREALASECCVILYESVHKICKTLGLIASIEPQRDLFLAREMTKIHEEYLSGTAKELAGELESRSSVKGEFVLIIRGAKHSTAS
ncbi:MAG: 16S rRNA (cytidine(1402)-2'-O)-methyltransferase [Bdellovibrionales bacterium]|nr:16S rRNA (cytidine(1402)-2'-O)-methyltransferase [Bdellovibrionales bacterium]